MMHCIVRGSRSGRVLEHTAPPTSAARGSVRRSASRWFISRSCVAATAPGPR